MAKTLLGAFLIANDISQADLARWIGRSEATVSRLVNGGMGASQSTIRAIIQSLSVRLARPVTYEELFGSPVEAAPESDPAQEPAC